MGKLINNIRRIFNDSLKGGLVITGNTCVVVGDINNKVRKFIKENGEYTVDWHEIGSSAYLDIPEKSIIKFAVLEWHSTIKKDDDIKHYTPISFETPTGNYELSIDKSSSNQAFFEDNYKQSVKWVDVSDLVKESGFYKVIGIPTNITEKEVKDLRDHDRTPGWSLSVVYENQEMPLRSISLYMGIENCSHDVKKLNSFLEIERFSIPKTPKSAFLSMVASNGDPNMYCAVNVYDHIKKVDNPQENAFIGNELDSSYENQETGSIMPYDNIFSGIIMNTNTESLDYGKIENRGILGEKNNFPFNVLNQEKFKGSRGKLDILSFDISDKILEYQDKIILVPYMDFLPPASPNIIVCGVQIDVLSDNIIQNNIVKIFEEELKGGIVTTGNTCAVIGDVNNKLMDFINPIGEYTLDCNEIGSSAYLEIPQDSTIKFAVLEWHSTVENRENKLSVEEEYSEIKLITPKKEHKLSIKIEDKTQAFYKDMFSKNKESVKWVDVTNLVKNDGEGFYTVKGIKTLILKDEYENAKNHNMPIGWSLNIVYEKEQTPLRRIGIYMGIKNQSYDVKKLNRAITMEINSKEFKENKKAYLSITSCGGDPNMYSGINVYDDLSDIDKLDPKYYLGSLLSATSIKHDDEIIPYDNAISGILMNTNTESLDYGKIDIRGTLGEKNNLLFGILNQKKFTGNRGKMDILSFDISDKIKENQKNLIFALDLHKIPSNSPSIISLATQIDL